MFKIKNKSAHKKFLGSSFSETMIVMTILGIVFTLSIGTMAADYNKNQTAVRLQKIYSVLGQAFIKSSTVNSAPVLWDFPDGMSERNSYTFFEKYLKPHLIISRDCKNSVTDSCNYNFKDFTGTEKALNSLWTRFYLNDGAFIAMQTISGEDYKVIYFYVDTNGKRRLNTIGRDIFIFEYWLENKLHPEWIGNLLPFGHEYTREQLISNVNENACSTKGNGSYCAALIMKDGWQIIKGYPWAHARYVVK